MTILPGKSSHGSRQVPVAAEILSSVDQDALLSALTSVDGRSSMAVDRTRRNVYSTNIEMDQQRKDRFKQGRTVIFFCLLFVTLLTPVLWSSVDSFFAGAHFVDPQTQTYLLPLMLFPGIVAVATIMFKKHQDRDGRREL